MPSETPVMNVLVRANTTAPAMSSPVPMRRAGLCSVRAANSAAFFCLAQAVVGAGVDGAGRDRVDADGRKLDGEAADDRVDGGVGGTDGEHADTRFAGRRAGEQHE